MPVGVKAVHWTPENDTKLFLTILNVHDVKIDAGKVATAFGSGADRQCISNRMARLRKKAGDLGVSSGVKSVLGKPTTAKRAPAGSKTGGKGRKRAGGILNDVASDDESVVDAKDETEQEEALLMSDSVDIAPITPNDSSKLQKTISGCVTKARISPRKSAKKDYKTLEDPFVAMNSTVDADGEKVFDTDKTMSEDSYPTDGEFGKAAMEATIKMEEAI